MMPKAALTYRNPVWDFDFPDPTIIRASDGFYYAYGTQTKRPGNLIVNLQVARSADLVHWDYLGEGLPQKPLWASTTQKFWAPHVSEHNGIYYLYYSAKPDTGVGLCLAVATSATAAGPFVDVGAPLQRGTGFLEIDPMAFDDPTTGKRLLYWGSGFGPIRVRELAEDRLSFASGSQEIVLLTPAGAGDPRRYDQLLEGSWVVLRQGWYYLFYSGNNCCGPDAHYGVLVARSRAATGPFETLAQATGNPYAMLLEGNEHWHAPGHNCVVADAAGQDWLAYHAIDPRQPTFDAIDDEQGFSRRVLLLDRLEYVDGWPRLVTGGTPSWQLQPGPVGG
ncbi:glycoside hydrolase family 43 protein [Hymenobacter sp. 5516J-16]|uniref:glycoside hydrolase family 43 protein n=1 Tax=Hymenobacter sp. 5516J-16 TaxID=2932253 RepID=UPI001FD3B808|nr:glycoside hydrolase family 43 protein [Hymenobacter sp. 5516J-16]UOQ75915.1 glycoside hydrolase family 43 protein [Hymenobacter sp. 5516J-16]